MPIYLYQPKNGYRCQLYEFCLPHVAKQRSCWSNDSDSPNRRRCRIHRSFVFVRWRQCALQSNSRSYVPQSCPCRLACGSAAFAGLAVVNRNQHTDRPRHITTPVEIARIYHCVVSAMRAKWGARGSERSAVLDSVASLPALGPWAPPSRTGPLARKYLPGFPYS